MNSVSMTSTTPITGRETKPVYVWAFVGVLFVLFQAYVYGAWILSDKFHAIAPGNEPVPSWFNGLLIFFQTGSILSSIAVVVWAIRSYRREGYVTSVVLFFFAWLLSYWQDPLANYYRLNFSYSSHFFNRGSWSEFIPGWVLPLGSNMPEPLLFAPGAYFAWQAYVGLMICACLRVAKRRWPSIGTLGLFLVAAAIGMVIDLVLEGGFIIPGAYRFTGIMYKFALWGGTFHQFPLQEIIFWGIVLAGGGLLMYFRDDKGHTVVERGCESIRSKTGNTFVRLMAITAMINLMFLLFNMVSWFLTFQMDPIPSGMPKHILNGVCGIGTPYECPAPDVPISLPGSPPIAPYTGRN
jgi:predicted secreted protein